MEDIDNLVTACYANNVIEVIKMISEDVDINVVDRRYGNTGLMMAMRNDNTEVVRILLGCSNIKIDIKNRNGNTALHYACLHHQVESVKLFLDHPDCNKEIVKMENDEGMTAEMMVDEEVNQECVRLVREYLEKNDGSTRVCDEECKIKNETSSEVAQRIEEIDPNKPLIRAKLKDDLKKELIKLEAEYSRKRKSIFERYEVLIKIFLSENDKTKREMHEELETWLAGPPGLKTKEEKNDKVMETKIDVLTVTGVANKKIEENNNNASLRITKLRDGQKKELDKLTEDHRNKISKLENDNKKELEKLVPEYERRLEKHETENKKLLSVSKQRYFSFDIDDSPCHSSYTVSRDQGWSFLSSFIMNNYANQTLLSIIRQFRNNKCRRDYEDLA